MNLIKHIPSLLLGLAVWIIVYILLGWEGIVLFIVVLVLGLLAVIYSEGKLRKKL